ERRYVPPKSAVEIKLAQYWQDALFVERVGIEDDFFELGGHSLLATQLATTIRDTFNVNIPLDIFFDTPNIAHVARHIEAAQWSNQDNPIATPELTTDEMEKFEI
ncbi:MAG: phosphopantetheine-binding protein, partial [Chloroflexota bacterium]